MSLTIPNLARLGLKRKVEEPLADLLTIQVLPYPVLANYKLLCGKMGWPQYGGGTALHQGPKQDGYINSGFRDDAIEGRLNSPHMFGIALDIIVIGRSKQIVAGNVAREYFNRVGIYPDRGIIHVDLADENWITTYNGRKFWVENKGMYSYFDTWEDVVTHLNS